ncbi:MAG: helix-turn-helix domain-containing protein [Firmicutes bacterium]|nr:helix-turn-helix domain-containing protein [Bacillota bacterium]
MIDIFVYFYYIVGGIMDNQKIGTFIKELRKEKNLTQKDLAGKLNITDRAISKWERGINCPDIFLLDDLSQILDVSVIEILKGRRLSKEEIINNKELVETMSFANKTLKEKLKKVIDTVTISIVVFISLLLLLYNIRGIYYSNKVYNTDSNQEISLQDKYINKINNNINLIENNQGKYNYEEYQLILNFINDIKYLTNKNIEQELINKTQFTIKDFNNFFDNMSIYDIYGYDGSNSYKQIYKIILKYDINKYDNMLNYNLAQRYYANSYQELSEIYYPIYLYNYNFKEHIGYEIYIKNLIQIKYSSYLLILNDIVEVGGIYE